MHLALIAVIALPSRSLAQPAGHAPALKPHIIRYSVAPAPNSGDETGPLHIIYSDGKEVVIRLARKKKSTPKGVVENQEGIADPQLAEDNQTLAWTESYDNCCTSYSIPMTLVLFRFGRILFRIHQGQMLWSWMFLDGGNQVATVWGFTHGPEVGDYQLYDVHTKRMISEVHGDEKTQSLPPDAPAWAKQLEAKLNRTPPTPSPHP